ncbi:ATP-binding protein [Siccirubricoccus sp. KC 17139]|uniref:histidine kinase n=1 Tax=Siccirubricoccus soli TaxID=2899147 RepID=A0ABT1DCZ8_9PROT|nr:ATP-binding protein [Siccirubricoccus soli]MCO6419808.1 ATP-binding protein [Siccirubricoccus soli]MCP2685943.1 ATP-binding protein [Siccirubricoccus soli]
MSNVRLAPAALPQTDAARDPANRPGWPQAGPRRESLLRLRVVLAVAFGVLAFLAAGGAALLAERDAGVALRQEAGSALAAAGRGIAGRLAMALQQRVQEMEFLAAQPDMRSATATAEERRTLLHSLAGRTPAYTILLFIDPAGRILATSDGRLEGALVAEREYFRRGLQGAFLGDVHDALLLRRADGEPPRLLDIAVPVTAADGRRLGVLAAHLDWNWVGALGQDSAALLERLQPGAEMVLLAKDGRVLLAPSATAPPWAGLGLAELVPGLAQPPPGTGAVVQGWRAAPGGPVQPYLTAWAWSRSRIGVDLGWVVMVRRDQAAAFAPALALRNRIFAWGLGVALLGAALGWGCATLLARPLEALAEQGGDGRRPTSREAALIGERLRRKRADLADRDLLLEAAPVGIIRVDGAGRILTANAAFRAMLGLGAGEAALPAAPPPGPGPVEASYRGGDGREVPVLHLFLPPDPASGEAHGFVIDLTEAKRSRAALAASEARLRAVLDAVPDAVMLLSADGRLRDVNPAGLRLLGAESAAALEGAELLPRIALPDRTAWAAHWAAVLAGATAGWEAGMLAPGGACLQVAVSGVPLALPQGRMVLLLCRDVTERRAAEARLRAAQAEAMRASRLGALGAMAAGLAHELNQPLSAMSNYAAAAALLLEQEQPGPARDAVRAALGQTRRLGAIVRRLRDFVGRAETELVLLPVATVLEEAAAAAREALPALRPGGGVVLAVEPPAEAGQVLADQVQLQQVLANLIRNAVEAVEAAVGSAERLVVLSGRRLCQGGVEFAVADTGPGLAPAVAGRLFEPFVSTKAAGGLGIGLALCRTIVEAHGGRIWAEKREGGGTVFRLRLPDADMAGEIAA